MLNALLVDQTRRTIMTAIESGLSFLAATQERGAGDVAFWERGAADTRLHATTALRELQERNTPHEIFGLSRVARETLNAADQALCSLYGSLYYLLQTMPSDDPVWSSTGEGHAMLAVIEAAWKQCFYARRADLSEIRSHDSADPVEATRRFLANWLEAELARYSTIKQVAHHSDAACAGCTDIEHVRLLLMWFDAAAEDGRLPASQADLAEAAVEHVGDHAGDHFASTMVDNLERSVLSACRQNGRGLEPAQLLRAIAHLASERLNDGRGVIAEAQAA